MRLRRTAFLVLLAGQILLFFACSPGPSTGTTTTTTGTGGMGGGVCAHADDYYDLCGGCELCLEEKCCPELSACRKVDGCIACNANDPNVTVDCNAIDEAYTLLICTQKCERCHPGFDASPQDCYAPSPADGGGGGP